MYASSCEKLRFFHLPEVGWKFFCCSDQQDAGSQLVRRTAFILISDLLKGSNSPSMTLSVVVAAVDIAHKLVGSVCCQHFLLSCDLQQEVGVRRSWQKP